MSLARTAARARAFALGSAVFSVFLIAVAYGATLMLRASPAWAAWLMATGTAGLFGALTFLGAARADRPHRVIAASVAFIVLVLLVPFGAALVLPVEGETAPLVLGLPLRAAIVIYGVGVLPALVLPFVYAWTFDSLTLSAEDLAAVREAARRARESA